MLELSDELIDKAPNRDRGYTGRVAASKEQRKQTISDAGSHRPNSGSRKTVAVDPENKSSNMKRLRRIEGQVRGLQKMVEEDRYCADILVQISSVQQALRAVGQALLGHHLRHCATHAIESGSPAKSEAMYAELVELFAKFAR